MSNLQILSPKEGYNLIAPYYDSWKWQEFWRRNEYPYIQRWCSHLVPGVGVDLGAGSGNNLECFLNAGHRVYAFDISEMMLMICQQKYEKEIYDGRLRRVVLDIREMNTIGKQYDWVLCNRVLSHIEDVANVIRRIASIVKQGCECFISDVHPLHRYEHTHFRVGSRDVIIDTYKHQLQEMTNLFYFNNFEILNFEEIKKADLFDKQVAENIHSIQDDVPIFYYYILRKI